MNSTHQSKSQQSQSKSQSQSHPTRRKRSLSISAVSRATTTTTTTPPQDIEIFSNKRDNPLFWSTTPPPGDVVPPPPPLQNPPSSSSSSSKAGSTGQRGRSVTRNSDYFAPPPTTTSSSSGGSNKNEIVSSSWVDVGSSAQRRGRSVSRPRTSSVYGYSSGGGASESEVEQQQETLSRRISSNYPHNTSSSNRQASSSATTTTTTTTTVKRAISAPALRNSSAAADTLHQTGRSLRSQLQPVLHPTTHPSAPADYSSPGLQISNWEGGISAGSLSEAEEKTIKAVYEQMKSIRGDNLVGDIATTGIYETVRSEVRRAITDIQLDLETAIRRNNVAAIASADVTDIPPDLVSPGAVELVLDIRREYAKKLDESQERARKLRQDLAVEEHRGQELSRILKETLPDPKITTTQRSRLGRRASSERKKMSKRLTDEAMSYFDECVSISTFDSSDFSAAEDSGFNSVGTTLTASLPPQEIPCTSASCGPKGCLNQKQMVTANSNSSSCHEAMVDQVSERGENTRESGRKFQFSFAKKPTENTGVLHQEEDIRRNYYMFRNFEKENIMINKSDMIISDSEISSNRCKYYDLEEGDYRRTESLLFDRVFLKNRTQSGSLHLCGGGGRIAISFLSCASLI